MADPSIFTNENLNAGLPRNSNFQVGVSDFDPGTIAEQGILIPWASDPAASWVYYDVAIACYLDSGIVVHRTLPQSNPAADTLAQCTITDANINTITGRGVNTVSKDKFKDLVQRMAHSQYWFCLYGQAMRVGYQIPIPGLKIVAGVPAIPSDDPSVQVAYNKIVGNYSGVPLWHGVWRLWYTVAVPPKIQQLPAPNLAANISAGSILPGAGIQSPFSQPDDMAQKTQPVQLQNPVAG